MIKGVFTAAAVGLGLSGMAAAEVVTDFEGEIGVGLGFIHEEGQEAVTDFIHDIELDFVVTITDQTNGLTYGASIALDELQEFEEKNPWEVFISGGFGRLSFGGDVDGAIDETLQKADDAGGGDAIGGDFEEHGGYSNNDFLDDENEDGTLTLLYENRFGPVGFNASISSVDKDDLNYQLGASYSLDLGKGSAEIAAAFGDFGKNDHRGLSFLYELNDFTLVLGYTEGFVDEKDIATKYIGIGYEIRNWAFHANYGVFTEDSEDVAGFGLGVDYAINDSLKLVSGYGKDDENEFASIGVYCEF